MKAILNRINRSSVLLFFLACVQVFYQAGCSGRRSFVPPPPLSDDRQSIPEPKVRKYNDLRDGFNKQFTMQTEQALDLARQSRHLTGDPKQAFNVDAFDEVPNSSWFTNRNVMERLSPEDVARGPDTGSGPDITNPWTVTRAKAEGVTPGFHIKDGHGDRYVIKFDPPGYSELATGAEVVSTKIFHAAGFNVPENYVVYFHPTILELADDVKFTDANGKIRFMNRADLKDLLAGIHTLSDGRIRALASKYVPGVPKGPFSYRGFRKDDPNDYIPHEHRRELRGLRVIAAWLNHTDTKSGNSFDTYITENGKSFIKHYLIDFGSTLGSAAHGPMKIQTGHENTIDLNAIFSRIITLGLYVRPWEKLAAITFPSIGRYESNVFDPGDFHFNFPNPAFDNCTVRDGFWGTKLVMSFTDEQLEAVVSQGQYSDSEASTYLLRTIRERRDKTGRYWYGRMNPLDRFELICDESGQFSLCFTDLAVEGGLESETDTFYRYGFHLESESISQSMETAEPCIPLPGRNDLHLSGNNGSNSSLKDRQLEVKIETRRDPGNKWSRWVKVFLTSDENNGSFTLLGIRRQD